MDYKESESMKKGIWNFKKNSEGAVKEYFGFQRSLLGLNCDFGFQKKSEVIENERLKREF